MGKMAGGKVDRWGVGGVMWQRGFRREFVAGGGGGLGWWVGGGGEVLAGIWYRIQGWGGWEGLKSLLAGR